MVSKWSKSIQNQSKPVIIVHTGPQNGQNGSKMGRKLSKLIQNRSKWVQNWSKSVKTGPKSVKIGRLILDHFGWILTILRPFQTDFGRFWLYFEQLKARIEEPDKRKNRMQWSSENMKESDRFFFPRNNRTTGVLSGSFALGSKRCQFLPHKKMVVL